MPNNSFHKSERLCGEIRIKELYRRGTKFVTWPLRVTYRQEEEGCCTGVRVLIWAPKSIFKHAVDRNRMRRVMREAYRLNNAPLDGLHMQISFVYMDKEQQPYAIIEKAMRKAIARIAKTVHHE